MKISFDVNNKTAYKISKQHLEMVIEKTISFSDLKCFAGKDVQLSIAFVAEDEIHNLNKIYRKKDYPTDVLSFYEYENGEDICKEKSDEIFLGELIICPDDIKKKAKENKIPFENEIIYITSHGVLHLLGMDHGKKMFAIQQKVVNDMGFGL